MSTLEAIAAAEDRARELGDRDPPPLVPSDQMPAPTGPIWKNAVFALISGHMALESGITGKPPMLLRG